MFFVFPVNRGLQFRNYHPRDKRLAHYEMEPTPVPPIAQEIEKKLAALESSEQDVCFFVFSIPPYSKSFYFLFLLYIG